MLARSRRFLALLVCALAVVPAGATSESAKAEAQLRDIRAEIERVRSQVQRDAAERERLARRLRDAEQSASAARAERAVRVQRRAVLAL
jgi:septal ring factor EnvC (AmiA/AmiB activator)